MANAESVGLRGYDSYAVSLGDEMRGQRATLGKSLLDVQRELRIKAAHIDAIERADPDSIPYTGFVTGYVRAYARYLGMDEFEVLRRFCAESGFEPTGGAAAPRRARIAEARPRSDLDAVIAGSRLAAVSRAQSVSADLGSTARAIGSLAVLVALVGALGYGGWAMLQSIQRVEFAPSPEAPGALAAAPDFDPMARIARAGVAAPPTIDSAALEAVYAAQEARPPTLFLRDGPIAALDPGSAGVYALAPQPDPASVASRRDVAQPQLEHPGAVAPAPEPAHRFASGAAAALPKQGLALVFEQEAWVRVRGADGGVLHESLMQAGSRWDAPEGAEGLTLRAGNAGGVRVEIDGALYGPIGRPGGVVKNLSLAADAIRAAFPPVDPAPVRSAGVVSTD